MTGLLGVLIIEGRLNCYDWNGFCEKISKKGVDRGDGF